ncbi:MULTISPECIES: A1S_2505 family phage non-structural protein [Aeromicrobium]|nr:MULTISPECIES: YbjN domain-containing protein [Aeromicrobium]
MSDSDMRDRAEQALKEACGVDHLAVDDDGDWPIDVQGTQIYVGVVEDPRPHVHVFTRIATQVSTEAWAEINHLNSAMIWAKVILGDEGAVFLSARLHPDGVTAEVLDTTLDAMAEYARDCGPMLEAVYGIANDGTTRPRTTPDAVTSLEPGGVFVFGSGAAGGHTGGAARLAVERFGAERGVSEGLRGDSYAIPTMEGFDVLAGAAARFLEFAADHPDRVFWLTRVGCGHAGFTDPDVAPLFADAPDNVVKPRGW